MEYYKTIMCQELRGNKGLACYTNVSSLLDFERAIANLFIIKVSGVRLHTFVAEDFINDLIMNVFEGGEKGKRESLFLKSKTFAVTIHRITYQSVTRSFTPNLIQHPTPPHPKDSQLPSGILR